MIKIRIGMKIRSKNENKDKINRSRKNKYFLSNQKDGEDIENGVARL